MFFARIRIRSRGKGISNMRNDINIPHKANRILHLILFAFVLIFLRVWYLGCVQREQHEQQSRKPKRKTTIEKVERATICDRFNIPLAYNTISYTASIRYADLREIPSHKWRKNEQGVKVKEPVRGPYITSLAKLLSKELQIDPQVIEDIIYAKASLFPHTPFVLKEGISEKQYYRLKMLQKDWRGIEAERVSKRVYPLHKVGCDVVGYMGAIDPKEYLAIAEETKTLQEYVKKREAGEIVFLPPGYENPLDVRKRLKLLQEKAYTINDSIGKAGVEHFCDEILRGIHGRGFYEIDPKGNILRKLPGSRAGVRGQKVCLAISAELQEYAEQLLAQHEIFRDMKDKDGRTLPGIPWIKGGAAIALDPKTGEVLALASYPRFDPNDFIAVSTPEEKKKQQENISRWLENERHIADLWNGKVSLTREIYSENSKDWSEETQPITLPYYFSTIIPPGTTLEKALSVLDNVKNAYELQKNFENVRKSLEIDDPAALLHVIYSQEGHIPGKKKFAPEVIEYIQSKLQSCDENSLTSIRALHPFLMHVKHNDNKLLLIDLMRMLLYFDGCSEDLIAKVGKLSLAEFFELTQQFQKVQSSVKEKVEQLHHEIGFKQWREKHFKEFLAKKRKEEKLAHKPAKPYTEYLEKIEKRLFKQFWQACKFVFLDAALSGKQRISLAKYPELEPYLDHLLSFNVEQNSALRQAVASLPPLLAMDFMKCMRGFDELSRPLYGKYRLVRSSQGVQLEKHLAAAFYPVSRFGYGRSQAFRQSTPQGSVFKMAVAYEALKEKFEYLKENDLALKDLNPLTVVDSMHAAVSPGSPKQLMGYTLEGAPIYRLYKGGMLPRKYPNIGKIDLIGAVEVSSNLYFALLAAEHVADPSYLEKMTQEFGLGNKTGIDLPGEIKGIIPEDLNDNKTSLYSFAMGQHSLIVTPLQTAMMYAAFANGGHILKPQILSLIVGEKREETPFLSSQKEEYPFRDSLRLVGIDFPLFTESLTPVHNSSVHKLPVEVKNTVFFPSEIRTLLMQSMQRVVLGNRGTARSGTIRYLKKYPAAGKCYEMMKDKVVGKTGTAEIFHRPWLDAEAIPEIRNHIWFCGIFFPESHKLMDQHWEEGDLVVVVYLRFSASGGKEAAPLGVLIANKWKEIQKKYAQESFVEKE